MTFSAKTGPILATASLLLVAACTTTVSAGLEGSEWQPVSIGNSSIPGGGDVFVGFTSDGKANGSGGCNSFFGAFEAGEATLQIGPLASTRKACPDEIMALDDAFTGALQAATGYKRDATDLVLLDDTGAVIMTLRQRDAD